MLNSFMCGGDVSAGLAGGITGSGKSAAEKGVGEGGAAGAEAHLQYHAKAGAPTQVRLHAALVEGDAAQMGESRGRGNVVVLLLGVCKTQGAIDYRPERGGCVGL